jgi:hypothetical protein
MQEEQENMRSTTCHKIPHIENFKKGDEHSCIKHLKRFMKKSGCLPHLDQHHRPPTTLFNDRLEAALRIYQRKLNVYVTIFLDTATLDSLRVPRCERNDVKSGPTHMLLPKQETQIPSYNGSPFPL